MRLGTARPSRDPRHLARLLGERLETVEPGFGVAAMRLVVALAEPLGAVQAAVPLGNAAAVEADLAPLVDRLAARFGEARVFRVLPVESDVPERSVQRAAPSPRQGVVPGPRTCRARCGCWCHRSRWRRSPPCRLDLTDGTAVLVYPTDRAGYGRLCQLLTLGKGRAGPGGCDLAWTDLAAQAEGLLAILLPDAADASLAAGLARLRAAFGNRAYLALTLRRRPGDAVRLRALETLAQAARVATVATGNVLYHQPERRILQDVVTCIRTGCTIDEAGFRRERSADRHLRGPGEMARLFRRHPEAVARSLEILERCRFSLGELRYQYPDEVEDPALTPQQTLDRLVWSAAPFRYPDGMPDDVAAQLRHELRLIEELDYAPYFLTVHAIVRYARGKDILCQGRGSAANSAVCMSSALPPLTRSGPGCCSSASSRPSGASRPTSTSISRPSGARRSSSGSMAATAATAPHSAPR
jgi:hypothetical protein